MVHQLIKYLYEEKGLGSRKISNKLNSWGIKTEGRNTWFNTSVHSVLKRKYQRDIRIKQIRKKTSPPKFSR